MLDLDALLDLATRAAVRAGGDLMERAGAVHQVETKTSATDPVSEADRAAEAQIVATLLEARPDDGLLGEEGADIVGRSGLRWVIDPLDGTVNYLYGLPAWSVSIACEAELDGGWQAVVGVVVNPLAGEVFRAQLGRGARLGDRLLTVNDPVTVDRALVGTGFSYQPEVRARQAAVAARLLPRIRDLRRLGSAALDLCLVAAGRCDAYYEDSTSRWDWAAGRLIATEARAVTSPLNAPEGGEGLLAAGPALHDPLRALLLDA